jgi:hypothetical protein
MHSSLKISVMCLALSAGVCIYPLIAPGKVDILLGVLIILIHLMLAASCWILSIEKNLLGMIYSETQSRSDHSDFILIIDYPAIASLVGWMGGLLFEINAAKLLKADIVFSFLAFSVGYYLAYFLGFNGSEWHRGIRLPRQGTRRQLIFSLVTLPMQVFILNLVLFNNYLFSIFVVLGSYLSGIVGSLIGRELAKSNIQIKRRLLVGFATIFFIVLLLQVYRLHLEANVVRESFKLLSDAL